VDSLARELSLPGLRGGPPGWAPLKHLAQVSPQAVLAELDRIEAHSSLDSEPEIKTQIEPVSPVFKDTESLRAWEAAERKKPTDKAA
jgi:hypothetical protein